MTTESSTNGGTTLSRMNLSGNVGHMTIFSWMFTIACCLVVGLWLRLGLWLDFGSGWLVVMHTYFYYFRLSLWHCLDSNDGAAERLGGRLYAGLGGCVDKRRRRSSFGKPASKRWKIIQCRFSRMNQGSGVRRYSDGKSVRLANTSGTFCCFYIITAYPPTRQFFSHRRPSFSGRHFPTVEHSVAERRRHSLFFRKRLDTSLLSFLLPISLVECAAQWGRNFRTP